MTRLLQCTGTLLLEKDITGVLPENIDKVILPFSFDPTGKNLLFIKRFRHDCEIQLFKC